MEDARRHRSPARLSPAETSPFASSGTTACNDTVQRGQPRAKQPNSPWSSPLRFDFECRLEDVDERLGPADEGVLQLESPEETAVTRRLQLFAIVLRRVESVGVEQLGEGFDDVEPSSVAKVGKSRLELVELSARLDDELLRLALAIAESGAESVVQRLETTDGLDQMGEGVVEDAEEVGARLRE